MCYTSGNYIQAYYVNWNIKKYNNSASVALPYTNELSENPYSKSFYQIQNYSVSYSKESNTWCVHFIKTLRRKIPDKKSNLVKEVACINCGEKGMKGQHRIALHKYKKDIKKQQNSVNDKKDMENRIYKLI